MNWMNDGGHRLTDQTTDKHELNALEGNNNTNTQTVNKLPYLLA